MNERIREFAKQAGFKLIRENCYDVVSTMSVQEFAELILKECLILFEEAKVNQEDDVDYGLEEAKNIIKEHFGVEE